MFIRPHPEAIAVLAKRLKRKELPPVTIALGVLCGGGLIVAADTRVVGADGSTFDATKVHSTVTESGCYVIANSTADGNAANTLIPHILRDLEQMDPKTLIEVEDVLINRMTRWVSAFSTAPVIQMVVGAFVDSVAGGGLALYFCEPPNTVRRHTWSDDSYGYVAVGTGASATDPLYRSLFSRMAPPRTRLLEISYLMYRAKKDYGAFCGGRTNAVLLKTEHVPPIHVLPLDMKFAEDMGRGLDVLLRMAANAVVSQTDERIEVFSQRVDTVIAYQSREYREMKFHSLGGEEIT